MSYGFELKNRAGKTLLGSQYFSMQRVQSGIKPIRFYDSKLQSVANEEESKIVLTGSITSVQNPISRKNTLIFARPHLRSDLAGFTDPKLMACWPMTVDYPEERVACILGPDNYNKNSEFTRPYTDNVQTQQGVRGRTFDMTVISEMYGGSDPVCQAYYEVWTIETNAIGDSEGDTPYGLRLFDEDGRAVFDSNKEAFSVENLVTWQPYLDWLPDQFPDLNTYAATYSPTVSLPMKETEIEAQGEYLALLNGGAHAVGIAKQGSTIHNAKVLTDNRRYQSFPIGVVDHPIGFYKAFVEWHYHTPEDIRCGLGPFIRHRVYKAYEKTSDDADSNLNHHYERIVENIGLRSTLMLGKTR